MLRTTGRTRRLVAGWGIARKGAATVLATASLVLVSLAAGAPAQAAAVDPKTPTTNPTPQVLTWTTCNPWKPLPTEEAAEQYPGKQIWSGVQYRTCLGHTSDGNLRSEVQVQNPTAWPFYYYSFYTWANVDGDNTLIGFKYCKSGYPSDGFKAIAAGGGTVSCAGEWFRAADHPGATSPVGVIIGFEGPGAAYLVKYFLN